MPRISSCFQGNHVEIEELMCVVLDLCYHCLCSCDTAKVTSDTVGNSRFDDTKETSNETKGLKRKAEILQKIEDFEDSRRSP
ncbi:hypothetical protein Tco_0394703 [Tanacetum coccineum]